MKWQPISEAPKDGTLILVSLWEFDQPNTERITTIASLEGDRWEEESGSEIYTPTHFMPLPDPPEGRT